MAFDIQDDLFGIGIDFIGQGQEFMDDDLVFCFLCCKVFSCLFSGWD